MRSLVALVLAVGLLGACEEPKPERDELHRRLGLRTHDEVAPRTTAGAGTSGGDDRVLLEPLPDDRAFDGTTGTTCDPTTGSTSPRDDARPAPARSGTTGGAPRALPSEPLPA